MCIRDRLAAAAGAERSDPLAGMLAGLQRDRERPAAGDGGGPVSYTHLRAPETVLDLVCRLLLEKKKH